MGVAGTDVKEPLFLLLLLLLSREHSVKGLHTRLEVRVAAFSSYSVAGMHVVRFAQLRSVVAVARIVMYCVENEHGVKGWQLRSEVGEGARV